MKKKMIVSKLIKKGITVITAGGLLLTSLSGVLMYTNSVYANEIYANETYTKEVYAKNYEAIDDNSKEINEINEHIQNAINASKNYRGIEITESLLANDKFTSSASSTGTDWMAMAIGRWGFIEDGEYKLFEDTKENCDVYLEALKNYVENKYAQSGTLSSTKATEFHRAIMVIAALGGDPTSFGEYEGESINLVADGTYNNPSPGKQGFNGWVYGLLALDTKAYTVPSDSQYTRESYIENILMLQLASTLNPSTSEDSINYGGWSLFGTASDPDMTAMAICALAPYYNDTTIYTYTNTKTKEELNKTVKMAIDEALNELGLMQTSDGDFRSWGSTNVESTAQVLLALTSVNINPNMDERFIKTTSQDGVEVTKTLIDGILKYETPTGGFAHTYSASKGYVFNSMANDQATYALVAYYRYLTGMNTLYNMSEETIAKDDENTGDNGTENNGGMEDNGSTGNNGVNVNDGVNGNNSITGDNGVKFPENEKVSLVDEAPKTLDRVNLNFVYIALAAMVVFTFSRKKKAIDENNN